MDRRVAGGQFDEVVVPKGYTAKVLIAWGDRSRMAQPSSRTQRTRRPTKNNSGACTTTASCISHCSELARFDRAEPSTPTTCCCSMTAEDGSVE